MHASCPSFPRRYRRLIPRPGGSAPPSRGGALPG
jgi:hypothetical protein